MALRNSLGGPIAAITKILVTVLVIVLTIHTLGWNNVTETLSQAKLIWVVYAVLVFFLSSVLGVVQWKILLSNRGIEINFARAFSLYFIGLFFNNFVLGAVASDAIRIAILRSANGKGKAGFAATFLDRFAGLWAMTGFAVAASIVLLRTHKMKTIVMAITIGSLIFTFAVFLFVLLVLMSKKLQAALFWIVERLPLPRKKLFVDTLHHILIETRDLHVVFWVGIISSVVQFMRIGVHIMCGAALGFLTARNILYFFIFVPIIAILMVIPLPFGVKEAIEGMIFSLSGVRPQQAMVLGFLASMVGVVSSLPGGIFFIFDNFKRKGLTYEDFGGNSLL